MVKIELDINGISFFVNTTWKTDAVPVVGDIVIVDKESISQFDRVELRKTPSNQAFRWADEEDNAPVLEHFDFDTEMVVKKRTWKFDAEDEEMVCVLKVTLMNELSKMNSVIKKLIPNAPHETLLVVDATSGQNGISQAKAFSEVTDITGIVLTKLDGTAKGGIVLAIKEEVNIPVKYVGLGEQEDDLEAFDIEKYIYGLFKDL